MKTLPRLLILACGLLAGQATALNAAGAEPKAAAAFTFQGQEYFARWSAANQYEFTPAKQEDLAQWTDMMTVDPFPLVHDGDALAAKANAVLGTYRANRGVVLRTNSIPRTEKSPAEHLIVVVLGQPNLLEAVFTRLKIVDGIGCAYVYSHRIYGAKVGNPMSDWLKEHGPSVEKALMEWSTLPSPSSLGK